ncbi:MFS transporter [Paenibacillus chartarius]|uniref:MFS transporter n=1 Tax=Paenibacillus chartarius TaxID=747481 RepID=A0ABV6DF40_9BACL
MEKLWNRHFVAVCLSSFFLFMTFYILAVTLPIFVTDELHAPQNRIGLVMTVFVIAAVIFRPLAGKWLDERDRKRILLYSMVLFLLCTCAYLIVGQFYGLLVLRFIHGIGFGVAATATGAIAVELVPASRKGEGVGFFSLFMSLAMVVGPFLGLTMLQYFDFNVLFGLCAALSLLSVVCVCVMRLPERMPRKEEPAKGWRKFAEPAAVPVSLAGSLLAFSYGAITTFLSVYAKELGMSAYASFFFMVFAAMIVVSRPFTGKLYDRRGPHVLVYPGFVLFVGGMIVLSLAGTPAVLLAAGGILGLGFGALLPSFQTMAIEASPPHRRGLATATYFMLFDTGYGIGSALLGVVAAHSGYRTMYGTAGLAVACAAVLYYALPHRMMNRRRRQQLV